MLTPARDLTSSPMPAAMVSAVTKAVSLRAGLKASHLALALIICYALEHGKAFRSPNGWLDDGLQPMPTDYLGIHAAGRLEADGKASAAYDWQEMKQAHAAAMGREQPAFFPFPYPPPYLGVAGALSLLGYAGGALAFLALTLAGYLIALRTITGSAERLAFAAASPVTLLNSYIVQNGFLTAGLLGGALAMLGRRPITAGILVGLLAVKPQLGVVIPFALIAGGHWRAFATAGVTVATMGAASTAAWGLEPWSGFLAHIATAFEAARNDPACLGKLQTLFGLLAKLGVPAEAALGAQAGLALASITTVTLLWRSDAPFGLKAAALATGSLLVSPYLFIYDFPLLIIAQAFLMRHADKAGTDKLEAFGLLAINATLLSAMVLPFPPGLFAVLGMAALIARRLPWPAWAARP